MSIFKCKMCGGTIEFEQGATVGVCDSCGTKQTLPKSNDEVISNLFSRANNLRLKCEFDKAEQIYEKIVDLDDSEAEAHWGIVLCKYGIEYVEDPVTFKKVPTCHRTLFEAVMSDADYIAAIENADAAQKELYIEEAKTIDALQKDILNIVQKEKPFDVFICYKETDQDGKRTVDSALANDIYYQLTKEGFKVFFAAITLEDKIGKEYEPYIFAALNSAKVMLVVGTTPNYFDAVWVRNEWSRFLKLMKTNRDKMLIPCYRDMDAYELPEEFAHLQAQDMSKIGFINDLVRGIKKVLVKEETAPIQSTVIPQSDSNGNISALLDRGFMALEDGEWQKADDFFEQVLNFDAKNANAYFGKLLADMKCKKAEDLQKATVPFDNNPNYQKAVRFGKNELENVNNAVKERLEEERKEKIYISNTSSMKTANSEQLFKNIANSLKSISGYKDADELAKQCLDKAEECRKRSVYEVALKKRFRGNYAIKSECEEVIRLLKNIKDYKDSAELIETAEATIAEIEAEEERERLENERIKEEERQKAEKKKKLIKKTAIIGTPIVAACIAFMIVLTTVIIPNVRLNNFKSGNYDIGDTVKFGNYHNSDEWIVLDKQENRMLLISKYALDCQPYNTSDIDVTWESCSLRKWLNDDFLNEAFSKKEQSIIAKIDISADNHPAYSTNPGNATTDKVFLLSIPEIEKYFTTDESRKCAPTAYAEAQGAYTSDSYKTASGEATCWWWLRSPGNNQNNAASVDIGGSVYYLGYSVYRDDFAVRPALWINLE